MFRFIKALSLTLVAVCFAAGPLNGTIAGNPPKLEFLFSFDVPATTPIGLTLNEAGDVLVTVRDTGSNPTFRGVKVFDKCGNFKFQFERLENLSNHDALSVATDSDGMIYVTYSDGIFVFDPKGNFLYEIILEIGMSPSPCGVAINAFGEIVVAVGARDRIDVFDRCGNLLRTFGEPGSGNGQFQGPTEVAVNSIVTSL